ncbi:spindle pole body component [Favolaschia claudopus]|uniref:Spindle pole body component n=1 Tax=Favolaschia claudopus TaxID=2862362 RepID=A0AAW0ABB6_9AGAR
MTQLFQLPTLSDEFDQLTLKDALPELMPRFFVPPMLDKPQNPILETLKLRDPIAPVPTPSRLLLPTELASVTLDSSPYNFPKLRESIWTDAIKNGSSHSEILSWDSLRPNYSGRPSPNAFISEQENLVFAAARYYVQPRLNDPHIEIKYVTQQELLSALKMTVLGTSSPLHSWDPVTETFVQVVTQKGARGVLAVDDKDEVVSESWIYGFLTIGTLMRRVEMLVASLSSGFAKEGPTIHAFTHAVSTILSYLREALAQCPPQDEHSSIILAAAWVQYAPYKDILVALAALCGRDERSSPINHTVLDHSPEPLLSLLYDHLHSHLERQSPTRVTAVIAFILTSASREYFHQLSRSVGFGGDSMAKKPARVVGEQNDQYALDLSDDGQEEERDEFESISESFPSFFPPDVVDIFPAAQKSLILLRAAEPDHLLLRTPPFQCTIEWFWTLNDIEMAWNQQRRQPQSTQPASMPEGIPPDAADSGLAQFRIFDLEPGGHFGHSLLDNKRTPTPIAALQDFLDAFPQTLHPITPTLAHLTTLVLEPLVKHASTLSSTLLSLFLSPLGPLQFQRHLKLLHSNLLLASPSFKSRLSAALFSDSQGYDADEEIPTSIRSIGARRKVSEKQKGRPHQWPIGLSFALFERETWPPVGADLSFFLRTVIVDSFEIPDERMDEGDVPSTRDMFWVEAERRLGFAIRDLPTGPGHDQWLNPPSIEALDFLYMDYKAPHPLDILITPETLSKYHRMFAYLLRIIRVEHALAAVFRVCRAAARPLFPTLTSSSKLLLHLRFIAHSFVTRLSEYVFDYAIGGNFDPFVASLSEGFRGGAAFPDVFALSRAHSALMDDVLSACLLRSSQRSAGDLLRQALEIVLEFAVLVGDLKTGKLEEYQAAPLLADLASSFKSKMLALTRSLKSILDKGSSDMEHNHKPSDPRKPTGGLPAVAHLLESLSEWWSN